MAFTDAPELVPVGSAGALAVHESAPFVGAAGIVAPGATGNVEAAGIAAPGATGNVGIGAIVGPADAVVVIIIAATLDDHDPRRHLHCRRTGAALPGQPGHVGRHPPADLGAVPAAVVVRAAVGTVGTVGTAGIVVPLIRATTNSAAPQSAYDPSTSDSQW